MADFKGGRGKKTGYETQMYRIPTPLKPVVEAMGMQFRLLWDGLIDPKGENLISRLEQVIPDPSQLKEATQDNLISSLREKEQKLISGLTELEAKLADCQQENADLKQKSREVARRLRKAISPITKGGDYTSNNAAGLKRVIEEVLLEVKES